jgi:hypothetical protein
VAIVTLQGVATLNMRSVSTTFVIVLSRISLKSASSDKPSSAQSSNSWDLNGSAPRSDDGRMITPTTIIPYMLSDADFRVRLRQHALRLDDVRDRVVADIVEERVFGQAELCAEFAVNDTGTSTAVHRGAMTGA